MRYHLSLEGFVIAYGTDDWLQYECNGSEPFDEFNYMHFKKNLETGEWINTYIEYQYIIIPTDLVPQLTDSAIKVQEICASRTFTIFLDKVTTASIQQDSVDVPTLPVAFTPCKILTFTAEDELLLNSIIDTFNSMYDPPRRIDFNCHFASIYELNAFISQNSVV